MINAAKFKAKLARVKARMRSRPMAHYQEREKLEGGRWVTMGKGEGGSRVYIKGGRIAAGGGGLEGKRLSDVRSKGKGQGREKPEYRRPWQKTDGGGYKMGRWSLAKEGKGWILKKDGVTVQELGRRASFDKAEGYIAKDEKKARQPKPFSQAKGIDKAGAAAWGKENKAAPEPSNSDKMVRLRRKFMELKAKQGAGEKSGKKAPEPFPAKRKSRDEAYEKRRAQRERAAQKKLDAKRAEQRARSKAAPKTLPHEGGDLRRTGPGRTPQEPPARPKKNSRDAAMADLKSMTAGRGKRPPQKGPRAHEGEGDNREWSGPSEFKKTAARFRKRLAAVKERARKQEKQGKAERKGFSKGAVAKRRSEVEGAGFKKSAKALQRRRMARGLPFADGLTIYAGDKESGGRWITIGSGKWTGPKGKSENVGGSRVFIRDGKIIKGAGGLVGKKLAELDKNKSAKARLATARKNLKAASKKAGGSKSISGDTGDLFGPGTSAPRRPEAEKVEVHQPKDSRAGGAKSASEQQLSEAHKAAVSRVAKVSKQGTDDDRSDIAAAVSISSSIKEFEETARSWGIDAGLVAEAKNEALRVLAGGQNEYGRLVSEISGIDRDIDSMKGGPYMRSKSEKSKLLQRRRELSDKLAKLERQS